jgi:hypothetical protein
MKERPILYKPEMVLAILNDLKTKTRRVVKWPVSISDHGMSHSPMVLRKGIWWKPEEISPYGKPGDRLWVREKLDMWPGGPCYAADGMTVDRMNVDWEWFENWERSYCPSIFMPRWASRITLEVINIRVARVQDISEKDVISEGIGAFTLARGVLSDAPPDPRWKFIELWNSINAKRGYGWDVNPWVWVIEFRRVK